MVSLPRAPLTVAKSGKADNPDRYASQMYRLAGDLREAAINELRLNQEYDEILNYISALRGDQWGRNRPKYRTAFVDNRIAKARIDSKAYLTDINPTVEISSKVESYKPHASLIQNCIHHEWRRLNMDLRLAAMVDHANFGIAFARIGGLMPGELIYKPFGMDTVLPIQRGENLQSSSAVLYSVNKPIQYFSKMFPGRTTGLERYADAAINSLSTNQYSKPGHIDQYTWDAMSPAMRYKLGTRIGRPAPAESDPFPTVKLEEFWIDDPAVNETGQRITIRNPYLSLEDHNYWYYVDPGQPLWPRKRLIIYGGEHRLLYDGPSPYWHGKYPFSELILDPVVWGPGGFSRYRVLMPIQKGINDINAGVLDMVKKSLNQSLIAKKGSVADTVFDRFFQDMPGGKMMMTPTSNPATDLRYGPIPELPGYTPQFLKHLYETFDRQSGGFDLSAVRNKKQVPSADVIQQMKDSQSAQFRLEGRYMEAHLEDVGPQAISNVIQYFTREKRIRLFGSNGVVKSDFDFDPRNLAPARGAPKEEHWQNFTCEVQPGSMHGGSKDNEQNRWFALFKAGAISLHELHRRLDIGNTDQILKEIIEEHGAGFGAQGPKQRSPRTNSQRKGAPA